MAIILVTGANQGIGYALLNRLGKETSGNTLLLGARSASKGEAAVKSLANDGVEAEFVLIDITDDKSIEDAAKSIDAKYGKLDVLVNNAGIASAPGTIRDAMQTVFNTNVFSLPVVLDTFKPLLIKSDVKKVITISSSIGSLDQTTKVRYPMPLPLLINYPSSKAALNLIIIRYSQEWEEDGIKFVALCPGNVSTSMNNSPNGKTPYQGAESAFTAIVTDDWKSGEFLQKEPDQDELTTVPW